ncbi:hypothetical protein DPSP01_013537 [Paraphaeosphaeria sporulosa]
MASNGTVTQMIEPNSVPASDGKPGSNSGSAAVEYVQGAGTEAPPNSPVLSPQDNLSPPHDFAKLVVAMMAEKGLISQWQRSA